MSAMTSVPATLVNPQDLAQVIVISPYPVDELHKLYAWLVEHSKETLDDYSPQTVADGINKFLDDNERGQRSYAVYNNQTIVGGLWFENLGGDMYMGHLCFEKHSLTSEQKVAAAKLALNMLFSAPAPARKICWAVMSDNRAFKIFLHKLGATIEGELKQQTLRKGEYVDLTLLASFPEAS